MSRSPTRWWRGSWTPPVRAERAATPVPGVVLVKSADLRATLRDLYRPGWRDYLAMVRPGCGRGRRPTTGPPRSPHWPTCPPRWPPRPVRGLAAELDRVPVLLVVFSDLAALAAVDRDAQRYTFAGGRPFTRSSGASCSPRAEGLGGVLTTMLIRERMRFAPARRPENWAVAAVLALGHRRTQPGDCGVGPCRRSPPSTGSVAHRSTIHRTIANHRSDNVIPYYAAISGVIGCTVP